MTLGGRAIEEMAELLFAADANSVPIGPLTERYPAMDVADADGSFTTAAFVQPGDRARPPSPVWAPCH